MEGWGPEGNEARWQSGSIQKEVTPLERVYLLLRMALVL